jgi:hypothetical protein
MTMGTATAAEARLGLCFQGSDSNVVTAGTLPTLSLIGQATTATGHAATNFTQVPVLGEAGVSYMTFGAQKSTISGLAKANGSVVHAGTAAIGIQARVQIDTWFQ